MNRQNQEQAPQAEKQRSGEATPSAEEQRYRQDTGTLEGGSHRMRLTYSKEFTDMAGRYVVSTTPIALV
jgi:hypothetical protein